MPDRTVEVEARYRLSRFSNVEVDTSVMEFGEPGREPAVFLMAGGVDPDLYPVAGEVVTVESQSLSGASIKVTSFDVAVDIDGYRAVKGERLARVGYEVVGKDPQILWRLTSANSSTGSWPGPGAKSPLSGYLLFPFPADETTLVLVAEVTDESVEFELAWVEPELPDVGDDSGDPDDLDTSDDIGNIDDLDDLDNPESTFKNTFTFNENTDTTVSILDTARVPLPGLPSVVPTTPTASTFADPIVPVPKTTVPTSVESQPEIDSSATTIATTGRQLTPEG